MGGEEISWRVKAWDRQLGRGVVTSEQVGDLPFDGSIALVDDFRIGETVEINVTRDGETYRVTKVWPDDPRFTPPQPSFPGAPQLETEIEQRIASALRDLPVSLDYRIARWEEDLVVEGDSNLFSHGAEIEIRFQGAAYIELPGGWDGKSHRLASASERDYLASRHEVTPRTVAVRVVDDARRVFFVLCDNVTWSRRR